MPTAAAARMLRLLRDSPTTTHEDPATALATDARMSYPIQCCGHHACNLTTHPFTAFLPKSAGLS